MLQRKLPRTRLTSIWTCGGLQKSQTHTVSKTLQQSTKNAQDYFQDFLDDVSINFPFLPFLLIWDYPLLSRIVYQKNLLVPLATPKKIED